MAPHAAIQSEAVSLRSEVHRLLSFVLRREIEDGENPSRAAEPEWDSLKHVELVFLIEDQFGMRLAEQEIAELEDAREIERFLEKRLAQKGASCGTA
jgi:acyl carrier protein